MKAIVVSERDVRAELVEVDEGALDGAVEVAVSHSSLNYKDGRALEGKGGIVRSWPLILGIDIIGEVTASTDDRFAPGDRVVLNGDGLGETRHGGFATKARVRPDFLVKLPEQISAHRAAAIGTAGFTSMLAVLALEDLGVTPDKGEVLVTGAAGGVGSVAISLLAGRGYRVVASTGRAEKEGDYLTQLGATRVIDRRPLGEPGGKPLQSQQWAAVIDSVGSHTLANAVAQTQYGGAAVACGMAQGIDLPGTVMPFILRAVTLTGANSVDAPLAARQRAWTRLAAELDLDQLDAMTHTIGLTDTIPAAEHILAGRIRGRTVIDTAR